MKLNPRKTKSHSDLNHLKAAQQVAVDALSEVVAYIKSKPEPTSDEAHDIIDTYLNSRGYKSPQGHIVASGSSSAEPHKSGVGKIKSNSPIVIDIYPRSNKTGFWGDVSRTVCVGEPPNELMEMYNKVSEAQELAFSMITPGANCKEIHAEILSFFTSSGYKTSGEGKEFTFAEGFVHSLGHGVGQDIHEEPILGAKSKDELQVGDVITVEPGLYYSHIGGVRIEDMIVVTKNGYENITNFPKQLRI